MSATVEVLGVYPIEFSRDILREHLRPVYGNTVTVQEFERIVKRNEDETRQDMENLQLIELLVDIDLESWRVGDLTQDHPQKSYSQVPYNEVYLSADGTEIEQGWKPTRRPFRIAFFLHFVDLNKPLYGPWGATNLPQPTSLPERLHSLIRYMPVT